MTDLGTDDPFGQTWALLTADPNGSDKTNRFMKGQLYPWN
jgi:hypothetical protein